MILLELFNVPYQYRWLDSSGSLVAARFDTDDGSTVQVEFVAVGAGWGTDPNKVENWVVSFYRSLNGKKAHKEDDGNSTYRITGQGDAYRVFATVGEIVKDFFRKHDPHALYFTSDEPSRSKLYSRMVPKLAKELGKRSHIQDLDRGSRQYVIS